MILSQTNPNFQQVERNSPIMGAFAEMMQRFRLAVLEQSVSMPLGTVGTSDQGNGVLYHKRSFDYELEGGV
jgi:hypothetical protein